MFFILKYLKLGLVNQYTCKNETQIQTPYWLKISDFNIEVGKIFNSQLPDNFYCLELKTSISLISFQNPVSES